MTRTVRHKLPEFSAVAQPGNTKVVKQLIWLYLILLLFEGALRKWFLPMLATPLLIIRDPVALLILLQAANRQLRVLNPYTLVIFTVTIISFLATFFSGHQNLVVALYGARITMLHFPLIFVIGQAFTRRDVERVGNFLLWVAPFMTVLIALQFYSPQTAWVNRGVGGEGSAGFSGAMGYFRPPGTFSFTNGTTLFFSLTAVFVTYFWQASDRAVNFLVLVAATLGVFIAIPLAISRGYLFQLVIIVMFFVAGSLVGGGRAVGRLGIAAVAVPVIMLMLSGLDFVQQGIQVFTQRFTNAAVSEGGLEGTLGERFLGGMANAVGDADELPFWGMGLGIGTNVGATVLTGGRTFLVAEGEWGRIIGEMGGLLGLIVVLTRVLLAIHCGLKSVFYLFQRRPLPWLLTSFGLLQIVTANWSQPTALGFSIFTTGLLVASFNEPTTASRHAA
ncbi:hypothetical protein [Lewinella sp. IMCC34183]|uniref:hypothetical protein n=1 Tax=Lewinella sp. IMCC34183 TaxID=2248762 RepID=UPI0018E5186C|nr:hypothetical protein [Lewinella sp. IMCC34183]